MPGAPHGAAPRFVTPTWMLNVLPAEANAVAGRSYTAVSGPVTRTIRAGIRAWVAASKATPSLSWIVPTSRYRPGLLGTRTGTTTESSLTVAATGATTSPRTSGATSVTGSTSGVGLAYGSTGAAGGGGEAAAPGSGMGEDAPGVTVVVPASSGSQRTPTSRPAGRLAAVAPDRSNVKFVVAPAVGGFDRPGVLNATPVPDSVG